MKKKWMALLMAGALFFQGVFGMGAAEVSANPDEASGGEAAYSATDATYGLAAPAAAAAAENVDSIITGVLVKDAKGTVIDAVYNPDNQQRSKLGDAVSIEYGWELPDGHGYTNGSTFEFKIPQEFKIFNEVKGKLTIDDGSSIADFTVGTNGDVKIVFNENVDNSRVWGTFKVNTVLSEEIKGRADVPIAFPIQGGEQNVMIKLAPKDGSLLKKTGIADKDKSIAWTIDVNTSLDKIDNAAVSDLIPPGLKLEESSIKVYELLPNVDKGPDLGNLVNPGSATYEAVVEPDGSGFQVKFKEPSITSAYRIQYTTLVTGEEETVFTNSAKLTGDNGVSKADDETITITRTPLFTKKDTSYDKETQTVTWRVQYNYGEKTITPADERLIHDRFNNSMVLVEDSVKVLKPGTNEPADGITYKVIPVTDDNGKNGFDLQFESEVTTAYDIEYQTKAIDRIYKDTPVTNDIYATVDGKERKGSDSFTFKSGIGVKSFGGVNYSTKELTWKIVVNEDKEPMTDLVIEDAFTGGGLEFIPGSVQVTSSGTGPAITPTVKDDKPAEGFSLTFAGTFTDKYTITYKTKFIPEKSQYLNKATLDWKEKTPGAEYPVQAPFTPNTETQKNGRKEGKSYDPKTKQLTWEIVANYNGNSVNNAVLTDKLEADQKLLKDEVKVYKATIGANGSVARGAEVTDPAKITEAADNTLRIELGDINSPYVITFKTKLENVLVVDKVPNTAVLTGDGDKPWSWYADLPIPRGGEYVNKSGTQNGGKIDWKIVINGSQSYVENATIIDTPSSNQILLSDSFELYEAVVNTDKSVTPVGQKLMKDQDYFLTIKTDPENDSQSFELKFAAQFIENAYVLQYSSEIAVSADREEVTNKASFAGEGIKNVSQESSNKIQVRFTDGSGTGSGIRGSLELTKVDKADPSQKLAGATFELLDNGGKLLGEKTTDEEGKLTFTKLRYDQVYSLVETEAPAGYILNGTPLTVKLDEKAKSTGGITKLTVENEKRTAPPVDPVEPKGKLTLVKVDDDDRTKVLAGATFKLVNSKDEFVGEQTTGDDGKLTFTDLPYGTYILKETAAPAGYLVEGEAERLITIDASLELTDNTLAITVENRKQTTNPGNPGSPSKPDKPSKPSDRNTPNDPTADPDVPTNPGTVITPSVDDTKPGGDDNAEIPDGSIPADGTNGDKPKDDKPKGDKPKPDPENPTDLELDDDGNPLGGTRGDRPSGEEFPGVSVLPKTGEGSTLPFQVAGGALILLGLLLRKKHLERK
ncbi:collagen binding domain-containing protein [Paenibacillus macerans]|uniref:collagen binding domain-containing protein n=1 Tax=Paenibacillus macerans TaxID=44252 RepID=UPI00203A5D78|nr:collagen binding domain-containing protein [Paenibacillus macerans]MCM3699326.1 SpaA isopeptide-forming pilin-related protein [Paenibacillus macerans]